MFFLYIFFIIASALCALIWVGQASGEEAIEDTLRIKNVVKYSLLFSGVSGLPVMAGKLLWAPEWIFSVEAVILTALCWKIKQRLRKRSLMLAFVSFMAGFYNAIAMAYGRVAIATTVVMFICCLLIFARYNGKEKKVISLRRRVPEKITFTEVSTLLAIIVLIALSLYAIRTVRF